MTNSEENQTILYSRDLARYISMKYRVSDKQARSMLADVFELITETVTAGGTVSVYRFGKFEPYIRQERKIRANLDGGKLVTHPPRLKFRFKPFEMTKAYVASGGDHGIVG